MADPEEYWKRILVESHLPIVMHRRMMSKLPSGPRCKACNSPFGRPWGPILRLLGKGRSAIHPLICTLCLRGLDKHQGGTEIELSLLFADVRGSTAMAEDIPAAEFGRLLNRFYEISNLVIDDEGGMIDKFLGDGVFALFIPGFSGEDHARRAVEAGRRLLAEVRDPATAESWLPVGVGVHTGTAFTGALGSGEGMLDFTAVGDSVNVAARLGSEAGPGELLASRAAAGSAGVEGGGLPRRRLRLEGRREEIEALVLS